jgi:hypothetical protein
MNVYKKLQTARIKLLNTKLNKSGYNSFSKYNYFELEDFIPAIQKICDEVGLCGVVSFTPDLAYLNIYDTESEGVIVFSSPMSTIALKGVHEVQNLGAIHTYLRRYLWVNAFEIVEHDALDAVSGKQEPKEVPKATPKPKPVEAPKPAEPEATTVEGAGIGTLSVPTAPEGDPTQWLEVVRDAALVALGFAESQADVMQVFKLNKTLFEAVKATDQAFFKELMAEFTKVKEKFPEVKKEESNG